MDLAKELSNMHNVYLFYPQYQDGVEPYMVQWLPYSVCVVWSYASQFSDIQKNYTVKDVIFKRESYKDIVDRMVDPKVCLFSNYIWNEQYNIGLVHAIKEKYPNAVCVFGGPNVHKNAQKFIDDFPIIDVAISNEGEYALLDFLRDFLKGYHKPTYNSTTRVDTTQSISPYINNEIMNRIVKNNPNTKWAMVMETNRGCPFACTFCDWGSLTHSKIKQFNLKSVFAEIDWLCDNKIEYLYIADANFGALYERDLEIVKYFAKKKKETGYPYVINVNWYKNATKKVLTLNKILKNAGLNIGITLSVQSLNDNTLDATKRKNMEISNLGEMYKECNEQGLQFYTEFILGLPNETLESFKHGISTSVDLGCHTSLDVYPLDVLRNSELNKQVDLYNLNIKTFKYLQPGQPTEIYEHSNYIVSTNTMTSDDIVEAWLWVYVVYNFHHYGWTQILQRFFYKHLNLKAETFYSNLFTDVIMKNDFLRLQYQQQKEMLTEIFYNNNDVYTFKNLDTYWGKQHLWHNHREHLYNDINAWAYNFFYKQHGVNKELVKEVCNLNQYCNVNKEVKTSFKKIFKHNLVEYIYFADLKLQHIESIYEFSNRISWVDDADFDQLIYRRVRYGFNIRDIKRIEA